MINWKSLVGETGVVELAQPFLVVGQVGPYAIPLSAGPAGASPIGKDPQGQPMVTQFMANATIKAFDEATGDLTISYDSPVSTSPATKPKMELHVDAANVLYFIKGSAIEIATAGAIAGPDGKPLM